MSSVFEFTNEKGEIFHLSKERWAHIRQDHPQVEQEEIEITLKKPIKILETSKEKHYYFHYFKHKNLPKKFLRVIVKYKNDKWIVMTAHFVAKIT